MAFFQLSRDGFVGLDSKKLPHEQPPPNDLAFNGRLQDSAAVGSMTLAQRNATLRKSKSDLYVSMEEEDRVQQARADRIAAVKHRKYEQYQTAIYGNPAEQAKQKAEVRQVLLAQAEARRAVLRQRQVASRSEAAAAMAIDEQVHLQAHEIRQREQQARLSVTAENARLHAAKLARDQAAKAQEHQLERSLANVETINWTKSLT
eukprot:m.12653 g.12653  ORF g.12653 m.12653 type:complete len:204 (-) comp10000_c0_seq1:29-640(-)